MRITCKCGTQLQVPDETVGQRVRCPKCQAVFTAEAEPPPVRIEPPPVRIEDAIENRSEKRVRPLEPEDDRERPRRSTDDDERRRHRDDDEPRRYRDDDERGRYRDDDEPRRNRDDDDDYRRRRPRDDEDEREVEFPSIIRIASIAWIVFGGLILLSGTASMLLAFAQPGAPGDVGARAAGGLCGMGLVLLFGLAFIFVGIQTMNGTAADTIGNAIGSLVIGLLNLGVGLVVVVSGAHAGGAAVIMGFIFGIISVTAGIALLAAGIMVLVGRDQYLAWRRNKIFLEELARRRGR